MYDFASEQVDPVEGYGGACVDDPNYEAVQKTYQDLLDRLRPTIKYANHGTINGGSVYSSTADMSSVNPRIDFRYIMNN